MPVNINFCGIFPQQLQRKHTKHFKLWKSVRFISIFLSYHSVHRPQTFVFADAGIVFFCSPIFRLVVFSAAALSLNINLAVTRETEEIWWFRIIFPSVHERTFVREYKKCARNSHNANAYGIPHRCGAHTLRDGLSCSLLWYRTVETLHSWLEWMLAGCWRFLYCWLALLELLRRNHLKEVGGFVSLQR